MPDPEDYVDAPADSLRAKLERQRKGKSQYGAIPKAIKKDPMGTLSLLTAALVPAGALPAPVGAAKSIVQGEREVGLLDVANKLGDPTSGIHNGIKGFGALLRGAKAAGERNAGAAKGAVVKKTGTYKGKSNKLGHGGRAQQLRDKGVPEGVIGQLARKAQAAPGQKNYHGAKKGGVVKAKGGPAVKRRDMPMMTKGKMPKGPHKMPNGKMMGASSGAMILDGFYSGTPQRSTTAAGAASSAIQNPVVPAANTAPGLQPRGTGGGSGTLAPVAGKLDSGGGIRAIGTGGGGGGGLVAAKVRGAAEGTVVKPSSSRLIYNGLHTSSGGKRD